MPKERYQITLNPILVKYARSMMAPLGHDSLSEYLESLIREEAQRRNLTNPEPMHDAPPKPVAPTVSGPNPGQTDRRVSYIKSKPARK